MQDHHAIGSLSDASALDRVQAMLINSMLAKTKKAVTDAAQKKGVSVPTEHIERIAWFRLQGFNRRNR